MHHNMSGCCAPATQRKTRLAEPGFSESVAERETANQGLIHGVPPLVMK